MNLVCSECNSQVTTKPVSKGSFDTLYECTGCGRKRVDVTEGNTRTIQLSEQQSA